MYMYLVCVVCVCVCVFVCVCVYVCVCVVYVWRRMCAYLCFYNISACYQVGLNSPSIIKLDLSSRELDHTQGELARSYTLCVGVHMSVENI